MCNKTDIVVYIFVYFNDARIHKKPKYQKNEVEMVGIFIICIFLFYLLNFPLSFVLDMLEAWWKLFCRSILKIVMIDWCIIMSMPEIIGEILHVTELYITGVNK